MRIVREEEKGKKEKKEKKKTYAYTSRRITGAACVARVIRTISRDEV